MTGRGLFGGLAASGAMAELIFRAQPYASTRIDLTEDIFADPYERLQAMKRVLDKRPSRRMRNGIPTPGPTSKRAKVKAARKANVRRLKS